MLRSILLGLLTSTAIATRTRDAKGKRQDGPVDPGTAADCSYWATAIDASYDCAFLEEDYAISHKDFVDWNPGVRSDCSGIKVGNSYCVEVNFGLPRPTSTKTTKTATPPAPTGTAKPSPTQEGLIESCTKFYFAKAGDTCQGIVNSYGTFTYANFVAWNPAVGSDCTNIWANTYYCVGIPGTPTAKPTTGPTGSVPPSPTQTGLISTCKTYYKAVAGDTCDKIVSSKGTFTSAQFLSWNPAVKSDCSGLIAGYYYCVGIASTPTTKPPAATTTKGVSPTQSGIISTCKTFYKAIAGDTCDKIVQKYGTFTSAQFLQWNPAVKSDCSGLIAGNYYCVGIPSTPTVKPTTLKTTKTGSAAIPTQTGIVANCQRWYKAVAGDDCQKIPQKFGTFTSAQFIKWNPAVKSDCSGLIAGYNYCIGIPGTPTVKPAPTPTGCTQANPSPTQPGATCKCKKWHKVVSGDGCASVEKKYSISAVQFHAWNAGLKNGDECAIWLGYNVCVSA